MAYASKEPKVKTGDGLDEMRTRYDRACDYWNPKFDLCREDIKFVTVPGEQWDSKFKARRGSRPCYEFPKLEQHTVQVINEMRQSRPQGKVRGLDETDKGLAELMQGIARNIESVSNADQAYDIAYSPAVQGGFGAWRICTDYANDDDFDLDIYIDPIRNPFSVKFDPAATAIDRRDAEFCFVEDTLPRDAFVKAYPNADPAAVLGEPMLSNWSERGQVRVCEYYYKEVKKELLWAIQGPPPPATALDMAPPQAPPVRISYAKDVYKATGLTTREQLEAAGWVISKEREVEKTCVYCRLTNGAEWLTDPVEFPSKFIPVIPVWGNLSFIDGDDYFKGMVRSSKDQQRLHNVHRTAAIEAVAKAPKAPFIAKPSWLGNYLPMWQKANAEDYAVLLLSDDAPDGAIPARAQQAEVPVALLQLAALDNEDIKAATGQYNPSLGAQSNATSGRALNAQKAQGAVATYNYIDNLVYAIRYQYEILVDMIPRVYDTQRVVRLLGEDGGSKWKTLYQQVPDPDNPGQFVTINDIGKGKYDTTVTVGPSYATQRMEAADAFSTLVGQVGPVLPQIAPILAFAAINNLDFPGADDTVEQVRTMLVRAGQLPPRDGDPQPEQPDPTQDPVFRANLEKLLSEVDKNRAQAAKTAAEAQTILPTAQANIEKTESETVGNTLGNVGSVAQAMQPVIPPQFPREPFNPNAAPFGPF